MGRVVKKAIRGITAGLVSSFLLAGVVTAVWNNLIIKVFSIGEIDFWETWAIYVVLSMFPVSVIVMHNSGK